VKRRGDSRRRGVFAGKSVLNYLTVVITPDLGHGGPVQSLDLRSRKQLMRALVVDDSRPIRRIESDILKALGFETADASNGKEALERLQSAPLPDVVLVDWNMPEMDGLEFITAVRRDARFSNLVVLMVTTETETDQMLRALSAGADEYLMKPFQKEGLVDKLRLVGVVK
jgi:two-component system chemotaxis response regulator CheY